MAATYASRSAAPVAYLIFHRNGAQQAHASGWGAAPSTVLWPVPNLPAPLAAPAMASDVPVDRNLL